MIVWGAIGKKEDQLLHIFDMLGKEKKKRVDTAVYKKVLYTCLLPIYQADTLFQQDNAPIHKFEVVKRFFGGSQI